MLRLLLLAVVLSACVTEEDTALSAQPGTAATTPTDAAIAYLAGGQWFRSLGCPSSDPSTCQYEGQFWIDLRIRNDAYDKTVGIVWIDEVRDDPSGPWHVAHARYEGPLDAPYEQWGLDVSTGGISGIEPHPRIRFAAFVEMAGTTSWDNNGGADHVVP